MSKTYLSFSVFLEKEVPAEEFQKILEAVKMIRGVSEIKFEEPCHERWLIRQRTLEEVRQMIVGISLNHG